jgi:DNA-directed RNA polymerase I subunit RPA1
MNGSVIDPMIFHRLGGVNFSYYKSKEIRDISVKEITNPVAFDQLSRPLNNGLYDPAMGVSPYDKISRCVTCG